MPVYSCTVQRRHGRITHQPEDVPFGRELPCYPPVSHGSSRIEVGDRGTRRFRTPHEWECLTLPSEATRTHTVFTERVWHSAAKCCNYKLTDTMAPKTQNKRQKARNIEGAKGKWRRKGQAETTVEAGKKRKKTGDKNKREARATRQAAARRAAIKEDEVQRCQNFKREERTSSTL